MSPKKKKNSSFNFVVNSLLKRLKLESVLGRSFKDKRKLYEILGYPETLSFQHYYARRRRGDIAKTIIDSYPNASWIKSPTVQDDSDKQNESPFELAFNLIAKKTRLFHYLNRVDKLSCLGEFAILFIGASDGGTLTSPLERVKPEEGILYFMPFSQLAVEIKELVEDPQDPRFGLPLIYEIQLTKDKKELVHWSRVIHIAQDKLDSDIYGQPMLENIYNLLLCLEKVLGGGSEVFWLNGRGALNLDVDKDYEVEDPKKLTEEIEQFTHQLSRVLRTQAIDVKPVQFNIPDPKPFVEGLLQLISGATGIPSRILLGSERGKLASNQDENTWLRRVHERREMFCELDILKPLIDRFIAIGALPAPANEDYEIVWPELVSLSNMDKAEIASKKAGAIAAYNNSPGSDLLITPKQFVEDILQEEYREDDINAAIAQENAQIDDDNQNLETDPSPEPNA